MMGLRWLVTRPMVCMPVDLWVILGVGGMGAVMVEELMADCLWEVAVVGSLLEEVSAGLLVTVAAEVEMADGKCALVDPMRESPLSIIFAVDG